MGYQKAMGIGSLSKYRRAFMIGGFVIFIGGAVLRWHHKRQLGGARALPDQSSLATGVSWKDDCVSYACRIVGSQGPSCLAMCTEATTLGSPTVRAERIAYACKQKCAADKFDTVSCRASCLIDESKKLLRR